MSQHDIPVGRSLLPLFQYASFTNAQGGTCEESPRSMRAFR